MLFFFLLTAILWDLFAFFLSYKELTKVPKWLNSRWFYDCTVFSFTVSFVVVIDVVVHVAVVGSLNHVWFFATLDCSVQGFPVNHLWELFKLMSIESVMLSNLILLSPPSPPAFNLSQHQRLFQWVNYLHQEAKVLELQLQYESFQWIFRVDFL